MSKWFCILLIACASAHAAPSTAPADEAVQFLNDKSLLNQIVEIQHNVTEKAQGKLSAVGQNVAHTAHQVADSTADLVITSMAFLGLPYRRGGNSAETGFDCSGFVRAMYQQTVGMLLPRRASEQAAATQAIDKKELQPGDLVFFNTMRRAFSHVGIYIGDGKFIHSPRSGSEVRVENMRASYWVQRFDGARRVAGLGSSASSY
ncbi:MAG: C40 family peptidase [Giesbergeria sp.]|uniref:C40 family peptidase n=1 Tax=Giesbergeria sp. TaxID=2818473 RepID=UPI002620B1A5|nr:C40 family peptidase [Giesbergeria sp.]MDD2609851.1 C40 family peptidase [Giesbergeria sp.]